MRFIHEIGFNVKVGKEEAYQKWLAENEAKVAAAHPPGTRYIGTFVVFFTSEKEAGFYRSIHEHDNHAAIDTHEALVKDEKSELGRLVREESQFIDYDPNAHWSNGLYESVVDAPIFDPK